MAKRAIKIVKKKMSLQARKRPAPLGHVRVTHHAPAEYSTPVQRLMELPAYKRILAQLQRGSSVSSIVQWMDKEGWMGGMTTSTITQYIYKFRTECPHLISVRETNPETAAESYDFYVGATIPATDVILELDKLIAVQRRRIAIDFKTEISIGKLLDNTHKEMLVLNDLLKQRAALTGEDMGSGLSSNETGTLRELQVSEADQDKMSLLAASLVKEIKGVNKAKTKKTVRAKA